MFFEILLHERGKDVWKQGVARIEEGGLSRKRPLRLCTGPLKSRNKRVKDMTSREAATGRAIAEWASFSSPQRLTFDRSTAVQNIDKTLTSEGVEDVDRVNLGTAQETSYLCHSTCDNKQPSDKRSRPGQLTTLTRWSPDVQHCSTKTLLVFQAHSTTPTTTQSKSRKPMTSTTLESMIVTGVRKDDTYSD